MLNEQPAGSPVSPLERASRTWLQASRSTRLPRGGRRIPDDHGRPGPDPVIFAAPGWETAGVPVAADACWRQPGSVHIPVALHHDWFIGTGTGGTAIEDQILAALAGEQVPISTSRILQKTGLQDCPDVVCQVLRRLERQEQVQSVPLPGALCWRRLTPPAPVPEVDL